MSKVLRQRQLPHRVRVGTTAHHRLRRRMHLSVPISGRGRREGADPAKRSLQRRSREHELHMCIVPVQERTQGQRRYSRKPTRTSRANHARHASPNDQLRTRCALAGQHHVNPMQMRASPKSELQATSPSGLPRDLTQRESNSSTSQARPLDSKLLPHS